MAGFTTQVWIPDVNHTVFCRLGNFQRKVTLRPAERLLVLCCFQEMFIRQVCAVLERNKLAILRRV